MQEMNPFSKMIAAALALSEKAVENTLELLEEGCTIPFISRYRKEKTGNMDEVKIEAVAQANEKYKEMAKPEDHRRARQAFGRVAAAHRQLLGRHRAGRHLSAF